MARSPISLHHVVLRDAVLGARTLTEAAQQLHISQPAVSKQLKQLQERLGYPLLSRHGRRLLPTTEAIALVEQLRRVNLSLGVLNRMAPDLRDQRHGTLSIACIPSLASTLLPGTLALLLRRHPDLSVSVRVANSAQIADLVETQQVEVGIGLSVREVTSVESSPLIAVWMECLLPRNHALLRKRALSSADFDGMPLITVGLPSGSTTPEPDWPGERFREHTRIRIDSSIAACRMAEAGIGIPVADCLTIAGFAGRRLHRRRLVDSPRYDVLAFRAHGRPSGLAVEDVLAVLHGHAREMAASLEA